MDHSINNLLTIEKEIQLKIIDINDAEIKDGGAGAFYIYLKRKK